MQSLEEPQSAAGCGKKKSTNKQRIKGRKLGDVLPLNAHTAKAPRRLLARPKAARPGDPTPGSTARSSQDSMPRAMTGGAAR